MAQLVALGKRAFVVALAGIGAEPLRCEDAESFGSALRRVALDREARLVFVAEPMAADAADAVQFFRRRSKAALLMLPIASSDEHPSLNEVRRLIEQATGASLI